MAEGSVTRLALVGERPELLDVEELVRIYLEYRLASSPSLSRSRVKGLRRTLGQFAEVVGPTPLDEAAVRRWLRSRAALTAGTQYEEFCTVRALCVWLGKRRFISPVMLSGPDWPCSARARGRREALERARSREQVFEEYLYGVGLSRRSVEEYVHEVVRARGWLAANGYDIDTVTPTGVVAYVDTRAPSWSTRKMIRCAIGHYWAMTKRPEPPTAAVRVPPKPRGRCRALDEDYSATLAQAARRRGDDPGLAVALMLYAGLRRSEVAQLRWECFDPNMEWLTVRGKLEVEATIPVHPRLRQLLLEKGRAQGWLFPGRFVGRPSTSARMYHWVRRVADDAGVPDVAPHRLRHVAISTVNDNTGDLRAAQDFARHADPRVTAIYTRTTQKRLRVAVEAIDY
jgi:integrase